MRRPLPTAAIPASRRKRASLPLPSRNPETGPRHCSRPAGSIDLDDAAAFIADVERTVIAADNRNRPQRRAIRLECDGRHGTAGVDAAHGSIAGVGNVDGAGGVDGHSARRVEARLGRHAISTGPGTGPPASVETVPSRAIARMQSL